MSEVRPPQATAIWQLPGSDAAALAALAFADSVVPDKLTLPAPGMSAPLAPNSLDLDLDDPTQSRFGDYTLKAKLGQGGMGVVYRAYQHSLGREVAVKLLAAGPWASPAFIERFRFEAQSAARMQHPNIITIFEAGAQDGLPFFSMQLVRGQALSDRIRQQGPMPARQAAHLLQVVAEAVDYAHRLGVLHLDLKPANVLLDERDQPMIADFGLARHIDQEQESDEISGTPNYMAPEQITLSHRLSEATDVYALGVTLFEALCGRPPFMAVNVRETMHLVAGAEPPTPRAFNPDLPIDLQAICLKCLRKAPDQRYSSARELAADIGRFLEGREVLARPLGQSARALRLVRREPRLSALAALLLLALLAGTVATTIQWRRADGNAQRARENLWQARTEAVQAALAEGDGFRGLRAMIANLEEMQASGRAEALALERQRIGTLLANSPQLIDMQQLPDGESITSVAIAPDAQRFAIALLQSDGTRLVRQYEVATGALNWTTVTEGLTHGLPNSSSMPHGWLRYASSGDLVLVGVMQQAPFAAPSAYDTIALDADSGAPLLPPASWADFTDLIVSEDGSKALLRFRSDPGERFPDLVQVVAPRDWRAQSPRVHASAIDHAIDFMFTPDGAGLLSTADYVAFALRDPRDLTSRWQFRVPDGAQVRAWRFSDDGRWLALGTQTGQVYLVSSDDGQRRTLAAGLVACVRWLEFDRHGGVLSAQAEDGTIMAWQVTDGSARMAPVYTNVRGVGRVRLAGGELVSADNERLRSWQLTPSAPFEIAAVPAAAQLRNRRGWWTHGFDVDADRRLIVTGGSDGALGLWRPPVSVVTPWRAAPLPAGHLRFDGQHIVAVDHDEVQLRDAADGRPRSPVWRHPEPVRFAELSAAGERLVTIAGRTLRVFDPIGGELIGEPILLPQTPLRAALAARAQVLALTTGEYVGPTFHERIHVVDLARGELREGHWRVPGTLDRFQLDPFGRRALVFAVTWPMVDNDALLIDFESGPSTCDKLAVREGHWPTEAEFSVDGDSIWLTSTLEDRVSRIERWDLASCSVAASHEQPSSGAFKRLHAVGSGLVVSAFSGDEISVFDAAATRRELPGLPRTQGMFEMAVSDDGARAAQATRNAVQLYDLRRGERLSTLMTAPIAGNDVIAKLAFSPDGSQLLARTYHGHWLRWSLPHAGESLTELAELAELLDPDASDSPSSIAAPLRARLRARDPARSVSAETPPPATVNVAALAAAATDARYLPLDLGPLLNVPLIGQWPSNRDMGGDRGTLAPGAQRFNDVDFRIDGGIQLAGSQYGTYFHPYHPDSGLLRFPPETLARVHVILMRHSPHGRKDAPRVQATVHLLGADGRDHELPIWHMRDVVQHAMPDALSGKSVRGRIAWSGVHGSALRRGQFSSSHTPSHLYAVALDVPADAGPILGIRLRVVPGPMEAPLFHAVTLERAVVPGT